MRCLGGSASQVSNFGSSHDLTVHEFKPHTGLSAVSAEPPLDPLSLSLSLSVCPSPAGSLSLKINKPKKNYKIY